MLPRLGRSTFVSRWLMLTLATSIIAMVDGGILMRWLALAPSRIWHGELWRLFTWPVIEGDPLALIFTCVTIFKFGTDLAVRWGDRRLERFVFQIAIAAGVLATLVAIIAGNRFVWRVGGWAIPDALVIAWARQFPTESVTIYSYLTLNGKRLIQLTVAVTVLFAIAYGPVYMAPELAACGLAVAYPRRWLRR